MKKIFGLLILVLMAFSSCSEKAINCFTDNYDFIQKPQTQTDIESKELVLEDGNKDVSNLFVINDFLLVKNSNNSKNLLSVYDLTGKKYGAFANLGKARNEFTRGMSLTAQFDGKAFCVNDVNTASLKEIDLKASLDSNKCVVKNVFSLGPRTMNSFYINDTLVVCEQETRDNYGLFLINPQNKKVISKKKIYEPHKKPFNVYNSRMVINKEKNKVAFAMRFVNQVNFMSLDSDWRKAVSLYDNAAMAKREKREYYCDIATDGKYVYALYMNQTLDDAFEKEKDMEIHVMDWNGNLVKVLHSKEYLVKLAVDSNGTLYGTDLDSNVYKYEMK